LPKDDFKVIDGDPGGHIGNEWHHLDKSPKYKIKGHTIVKSGNGPEQLLELLKKK